MGLYIEVRPTERDHKQGTQRSHCLVLEVTSRCPTFLVLYSVKGFRFPSLDTGLNLFSSATQLSTYFLSPRPSTPLSFLVVLLGSFHLALFSCETGVSSVDQYTCRKDVSSSTHTT